MTLSYKYPVKHWKLDDGPKHFDVMGTQFIMWELENEMDHKNYYFRWWDIFVYFLKMRNNLNIALYLYWNSKYSIVNINMAV